MGRLTNPSKVLLIGFVLAGSMACAGYALTYRDDARVERAVAACKADDLATATDPSTKKEFQFTLLCEPSEFYGHMSDAWVSPQKEVRDAIAERGANSGPVILYFLAFVTAFGAALPWAWYFLLRRLRELREAVIGR